MNIFILDTDYRKAAQYHNDKHVVKMILESAQLLCNVHHVNGNPQRLTAPYKATHLNHPCSIWARESQMNYVWLVKFALELCKEYTHRYYKIHATQKIIEWCARHYPHFDKMNRTPHPICVPKECLVGTDPVLSYRRYYMVHKKDFCKWRNREIPYWFKHIVQHQLLLNVRP